MNLTRLTGINSPHGYYRYPYYPSTHFLSVWNMSHQIFYLFFAQSIFDPPISDPTCSFSSTTRDMLMSLILFWCTSILLEIWITYLFHKYDLLGMSFQVASESWDEYLLTTSIGMFQTKPICFQMKWELVTYLIMCNIEQWFHWFAYIDIWDNHLCRSHIKRVLNKKENEREKKDPCLQRWC